MRSIQTRSICLMSSRINQTHSLQRVIGEFGNEGKNARTLGLCPAFFSDSAETKAYSTVSFLEFWSLSGNEEKLLVFLAFYTMIRN